MLLIVPIAGWSASIVNSVASCFLTASLTLRPVIGLVSVMLVPTSSSTSACDDVLKRDGPAMRALHPSHGLHAVDMAISRAAVEIIGADREAHEFLEQIEVFVGAAAGDQSAERLRAMRQLEPVGLFGHIFQRLFPCGFDQRAVPSDQADGSGGLGWLVA